jgi:hypothetical protein
MYHRLILIGSFALIGHFKALADAICEAHISPRPRSSVTFLYIVYPQPRLPYNCPGKKKVGFGFRAG